LAYVHEWLLLFSVGRQPGESLVRSRGQGESSFPVESATKVRVGCRDADLLARPRRRVHCSGDAPGTAPPIDSRSV